MSTLLKKPFIEEVVDGLDDQTISSFQKFLDMGEGYSATYSLRGGELPAGANPSVERCTLLIDGPAQLCGVYAKYKKGNENRSAMISFTTLESCTMYEIDEGRLTCRRVRERLSASELRRVLRERDIAKTENGSVIYNDGIEVKSNGDVVIGKNLEVDGNVFTLNGKEYGIMPVRFFNDNNLIVEAGFIFSDSLPTLESDRTSLDVSGIWLNIANDQILICDTLDSFQPNSPKTNIIDGVLFIGNEDEEAFSNLFQTFAIGNFQRQLYRHELILNNKYRWAFICNNNTKVDSLTKLSLITQAVPEEQFTLDSSTFAIFSNGTWHVGTDSISTVSDTVTRL